MINDIIKEFFCFNLFFKIEIGRAVIKINIPATFVFIAALIVMIND